MSELKYEAPKPMPFAKSGKLARKHRKANELYLGVCAKRIGVSPSTLSSFEHGYSLLEYKELRRFIEMIKDPDERVKLALLIADESRARYTKEPTRKKKAK